jgi:hypothetical protein
MSVHHFGKISFMFIGTVSVDLHLKSGFTALLKPFLRLNRRLVHVSSPSLGVTSSSKLFGHTGRVIVAHHSPPSAFPLSTKHGARLDLLPLWLHHDTSARSSAGPVAEGDSAVRTIRRTAWLDHQ